MSERRHRYASKFFLEGIEGDELSAEILSSASVSSFCQRQRRVRVKTQLTVSWVLQRGCCGKAGVGNGLRS